MSAGVNATSSVIASILPRNFLTHLQNEKKEDTICSVSLLIANVIVRALSAIKQGNLKQLDGNPGNGSCQNQALIICQLYHTGLDEEGIILLKKGGKLKKRIMRRKQNQKESRKTAPLAFFQQYVTPLEVSKKWEFVLHSHLLWVVKLPHQTLPNGIVITKSCPGRLEALSKGFSKIDCAFKRLLVEQSQLTHSLMSLEKVREIASGLWGLSPFSKEVLVQMLSTKNTHLYSPNEKKYAPKAYGCLFYLMKTLLFRLREVEALICLKSIETEKKPFCLFFQPESPGEEFALVQEESLTKIDKKMGIIVFQAVSSIDSSSAATNLIAEGITEALLCRAAFEPPYEGSSTLSSIQMEEGIEEIKAYQAMGKGSYLILDHIYANTLGKEDI
jgi:hypothetical protein